MVDSEGLKKYSVSLGFDTVGVCSAAPPPHLDSYERWIGKGYHGAMEYLARHLPAKADPRKLLPDARSIVAVTLNYNQPNPKRNGYPRIARYALGRDYHKVIRTKLARLGKWIEGAYPGAQCRACVDSAPIMERDYAQMAGLGWFGKNTMLIDSKRGSWFFIGLLLTTVEFETDPPALGGCGSCRACVDACPSEAIVFEEGRWQVDARRCISYLTIEQKGAIELDIAGWTFGCDICQEVCPFNEPRENQPLRARTTVEPDFLRATEWPSLERLRVIGDEEWDILTRGSALRRAGRDGLRRNAARCLESPAGADP
ncbi:MAG TPA: tRNA epoxyqueuosine(34) reductase QueG [Fimbriimonadaceae bacterium]|nr:tRNA epoxyqueuosine(34) reductase QueG [Fimbriimonadaceae bacterium]